MSNQYHYELLIKAHEELYEDIYSVVETMCELDGSRPPYDLEECEVYINQSRIQVEWEEYHGGCGSYTEGHSVEFPTSYLWTSEWEHEERQRRLEANLKAIAERKQKEEVQRRKEEAAAYEQYVELHARFGDVELNLKKEDNKGTV